MSSNQKNITMTQFRGTFFALIAGVMISGQIARADLSDAIVELIEEFDGIRNDTTPLGVTDGNPLAATSFMARTAFDHYGLRPRISAAPKTADNNWIFDIDVSLGSFDSGSFEGYYSITDFELATRFSDTVALSLLIPFEYRNTTHTDTYISGLELGLPITIIPDRDAGLSWVVTPSIMATGVGISINLAQGGYLFGGGMTSSLAWQSGALTLIMANQATYAWGRPISYDEDFDLRQDISQPILKNGFAIAYALGDTLSLDAAITWSNLLHEAYIDDYWTGDLGATVRFDRDSGIRLGFRSDFADNFKTYGGEFQFFISF